MLPTREVWASWPSTESLQRSTWVPFPSAEMPQYHDVGDEGITSLLFSGAAACVGGGFPSILPGFPPEALIYSAENATNFVETRIREGVDYLKIFINEDNLPKQEFQQIIKDKAEAAGKVVVTHAPYYGAQEIARAVGGNTSPTRPSSRPWTNRQYSKCATSNKSPSRP